MMDKIAGIVLAGGRSSRMGQNKALLNYHGKPLLTHMVDTLMAIGLKHIFISGDVDGYECIRDRRPFAGPACAIRDVIQQTSGYKGYLFVPVDMPKIHPLLLSDLISHKEGGYFIGHPLPLFLTPPVIMNDKHSIQGLIDAQGIYPIDLPHHYDEAMLNANTPKEWLEALSTP